jgi:hypothetical protein
MPRSEKNKFRAGTSGVSGLIIFCGIETRSVSNVMQKESAWGQLGVSEKSNNCQKL